MARQIIACVLLILFFALAALAQVRVDVYPSMAVINPYKLSFFRFRFQIEPNPDNRKYQIEYDCGGEIHRAEREVDAITTTRYVKLTVLGDCLFMACVVRTVEGKEKTFCSYQIIHTPKEGE